MDDGARKKRCLIVRNVHLSERSVARLSKMIALATRISQVALLSYLLVAYLNFERILMRHFIVRGATPAPTSRHTTHCGLKWKKVAQK